MKLSILALIISLVSFSVHSESDPYLDSYYAGACYVLNALKKDNKMQAEKIKAFRDIDFYLTRCDEYTSSFNKHYGSKLPFKNSDK